MGNFIKDFWDSNAEKYKLSHFVSWGDECAIKLETENISHYIKDGDHVLDVGCANGFASIMQCMAHNVGSMTGVDFSEKMIEYAQENRANSEFADKLSFAQGDVRSLQFADESFDVVYTTRVVINLPNWEEQKQAFTECLRVCKKGGTVVFSEAFWEPLTRLNALRAVAQLPPLVEHDFNRYIKIARMETFLQELGYAYERVDFSSVYYVGSRLLRELATDYTSFEGYSNPINKDFYELEKKYSGGNFGIQQAFVIRK